MSTSFFRAATIAEQSKDQIRNCITYSHDSIIHIYSNKCNVPEIWKKSLFNVLYYIKIFFYYMKNWLVWIFSKNLYKLTLSLSNWFFSSIFYCFHLNTLFWWRLCCCCSSIKSRRKVQRIRLAIEEWRTVRKNFAYISSQLWSDQSLSHGRESRYHDSNPQNFKNNLEFSIGRYVTYFLNWIYLQREDNDAFIFRELAAFDVFKNWFELPNLPYILCVLNLRLHAVVCAISTFCSKF